MFAVIFDMNHSQLHYSNHYDQPVSSLVEKKMSLSFGAVHFLPRSCKSLTRV